jgi:ATP-dependent Clp protease ATP-binding subunit ClpA
MPTDETNDYLAAEAEANRLVDELTELKREVESYRNARVVLDGLGERLGQVAVELAILAKATAKNVETLVNIGAPELLELQRKSEKRLAALDQAVGAHSRALKDELKGLRRLIVGAGAAGILGILAIIAVLVVLRP